MTKASEILKAEAIRYRRLEALTVDCRVSVILRDMAIACDERAHTLDNAKPPIV